MFLLFVCTTFCLHCELLHIIGSSLLSGAHTCFCHSPPPAPAFAHYVLNFYTCEFLCSKPLLLWCWHVIFIRLGFIWSTSWHWTQTQEESRSLASSVFLLGMSSIGSAFAPHQTGSSWPGDEKHCLLACTILMLFSSFPDPFSLLL